MRLALLAVAITFLVGLAAGVVLERWLGRLRFKRTVLSQQPELPKETVQRWADEL